MFVLQNYVQHTDATAENPRSSLEVVNGLWSEVKLAHQPCDNEPERPHKYCASELHPYKKTVGFSGIGYYPKLFLLAEVTQIKVNR